MNELDPRIKKNLVASLDTRNEITKAITLLFGIGGIFVAIGELTFLKWLGLVEFKTNYDMYFTFGATLAISTILIACEVFIRIKNSKDKVFHYIDSLDGIIWIYTKKIVGGDSYALWLGTKDHALHEFRFATENLRNQCLNDLKQTFPNAKLEYSYQMEKEFTANSSLMNSNIVENAGENLDDANKTQRDAELKDAQKVKMIVQRSLEGTRIALLIVIIVFGGFALLSSYHTIKYSSDNTFMISISIVMSLITILVLIGYLWTFKYNVYKEVFENDCKNLVWIYETINNINGSEHLSVTVSTNQGKQYNIDVKNREDLTHMMAYLQKKLPHIIYGYSHDLFKLYLRNRSTFLQLLASKSENQNKS